jgi:hypothetical protein
MRRKRSLARGLSTTASKICVLGQAVVSGDLMEQERWLAPSCALLFTFYILINRSDGTFQRV